jgi:hypothetical protein
VIRLVGTGSIRLTRKEIERFTLVSGFSPDWVKTLDQLMAFVSWCKTYYGTHTEDGRFLQRHVDATLHFCLRGSR